MQTQHEHTNALPTAQVSDLRVMKHFIVPPEGVVFVADHPLQMLGVRRVGMKFIAYGLEMAMDVAPKRIMIKWFMPNCYIPPKLKYLGSEAAANDLLHFYYGPVEYFSE